MSTFVIGDIHGGHLALKQCLERCNFNPVEDTLISLGDVCDGWPFVKECVNILEALPNFKLVIGNHDWWAMTWARGGDAVQEWVTQGGRATLESFIYLRENFPIDFFERGRMAYECEGQIFVHGGLDPNQANLDMQDPHLMMWDRELIQMARRKHNQKPDFKYGGWKDIFIGHTTTQFFNNSLEPLHYCNVWDIDTGGGWSGKLTIMDVESKEYWQSDLLPELYPGIPGRG